MCFMTNGFLVFRLEKKRVVGILLLPVVGFVCMVGWVFCFLGEQRVVTKKNVVGREGAGEMNFFMRGRDVEMPPSSSHRSLLQN
jgi:hypothetical protein